MFPPDQNLHRLTARRYETGEPIELTLDRDVTWTDLSEKPFAPSECWMAPGLLDIQVNGFAGVDFQRDDLRTEDLLRAVRGLRKAGCTRFLLTLITDEWHRIISRLERLRQLRAASAEMSSAIAGWHIEGPFLSEKPGYHGAHDPALMIDPRPEHLRELRDTTAGDPVLLTLAPERSGALEMIAHARTLGMVVSLGHTDASAEILGAAVVAGATGFTHLGNACPQQLDRHDNILWRVLDTPGLTVSLIPDCIHVSPALFRMIHRVLPPERIVYTTDAMSAAGSPAGRYPLGRLELEVGVDGIVRYPGRSNFAGSALRPIEGVVRAARMLGRSWREVWDAFSVGPARFMGHPVCMDDGHTPGCLVGETGGAEEIEVRAVWNSCALPIVNPDSRKKE